MQRWLNVGDYIVYRLCGEAAIDYSMASQTLCLDQRRLALRGDLLAAFGLPKTIFPAPGTAGTPLGTLSCTAADDTGLQEGTLVVLGGADFVTGVYGAGVTSPGDTAILTGTWENVVSCLRMPELSSPLERAGAICDAHVIPGRWSLRIENLVGDVTEWYRAELGSLHSPTAGEDPAFWDLLSQEARESVPGAGGVVLVPHLFGSYGPRYDELARGTLVGLTNRTTRKEIARALFEGLCFQSRHTFEGLVQASGLKTERLVFMGGAAKNALWTQTRANVMGRAAEVVLAPDVTPRGAAMVAGVGAGVFAGFEEAANAMVPKTEMIEPDETLRELYDELFTSVYLPTVEAVAPINHSLARLGRFTASGDQAASQPLRTSEASP